MKQFSLWLAAFLCLILLRVQAQQTQLPAIKLEDFASGFNNPTDIENAGDARLFVVEKPGKIRICDLNGNVFPNLFLDISGQVLAALNLLSFC